MIKVQQSPLQFIENIDIGKGIGQKRTLLFNPIIGELIKAVKGGNGYEMEIKK